MGIKKDIPLSLIKPSKSNMTKDMVGKKYGRLYILEYLGAYINEAKTNKRQMVLAKCDCGSTHIYDARPIRLGTSTSCGCFQSEFSSKRHTTHGQKSPKHGNRGTVLYSRWRSMFDRVRSDHNYKNVTISDRWKGGNGFVNFCSDMGEMPTPKHTVDRYPIIKGNYEPSNVRWATMKEQMQNMSRNVNYMFNGELLCVSEIARRINIEPKELQRRLRVLNLTLEQAIIYIPLKTKRNVNIITI